MDTACSSALVGAHLGMQHLGAHGGSALAAGVNLALAEITTAAAQVAGMLTLDGRCKTLDAAADGYVRRASSHCRGTLFGVMTLWQLQALSLASLTSRRVHAICYGRHS